MLSELKKEFLRLLKEDLEFRYAVAGLIGLDEILKRLKKHDEKFNEILERLDRHEAELTRLRQDMVDGFKRYDEEFAKIWSEIAKLREDMVAGFRRHNEEIAKLRQDMMEGFRRHDEILEKHSEEIIRLREDMNRGFSLLERHITALGARWGLMAEEAFREGLRSLLDEEFGLKVERWRFFDSEGLVYGYPSEVEVDVAISDRKLILLEVSSHVRRSDVSEFKRKAELYEKITGRRPDRLVIVTPYIEERAVKLARELGIEVRRA